ncbi:hypothetical protein EBR21_00460 [bacterium]|nr:hypothetical protein [bacterium]
MIHINLAPQVDQSSSRNQILIHLGLVAVLCVMAYYGTEVYSEKYTQEATNVENKTTELRQTKASLKKDLERAKEIRLRTEQIRTRTARVRQLGEGRKLAVVLLDSLQSKHPERMWFNKISYSTKTKSLILAGYALDHTVIADYMKRLKEIGKIDAGDLAELKDYIPPQLLNTDVKQTIVATQSRADVQSLDQVTLKQLISSEELQGVTLQKFEISIRITSG